MKINNQLTLDFTLKNHIDIVHAKRGDTKSRFIEVKLRDNGLNVSLANHTVKLYALKPDGKKVFNDLVITDPAAGLVTLELTNQTLAVVGLVKCELSIYGTDTSLIATRTFFIDVDDTIRDDAAIVSSNEFTALTTGIQKLEQWDGQFQQKYNGLEAQYAADLTNVKSQLAENVSQINDIQYSIDETQSLNTQLSLVPQSAKVKLNSSIEATSALTNAKDKIFVGKGEIKRNSSGTKVENFFVDVKKVPNVFTGKVNKFNSYSVLKAFVDKSKAGSAKVAVIGDSIITTGGTNLSISYDSFTANGSWSYSPNGLTEVDSYFYRLCESLTKAFKTTAFSIYNYAIGGTNLTQYNDQQTFSGVTKAWIDFIKDQSPDLVLINFGMNHSNYLIARQTKYYLSTLLDYIATWTNPPVVVLTTPPRPVMDMTDATYGVGHAQLSRHSTAHAIRTIGEQRGCYVIDNNHLYNCVKDGIDFERMFMVRETPVFGGSSVNNGDGTFTMALNQTININNGLKDYILEFDIDVASASALTSSEYLDVILNNAIDGNSNVIMNNRTLIFPNNASSLFAINNYGNVADATHYPNVSKSGTSGRTNKMSIRIEKRGDELNIYNNRMRIIRDRLTCVDVPGYTQLLCKITNGCTISNIKLYKAKYIQYIPLLSDTEAWGQYMPGDTSTKSYAGGNGVNHPSNFLLEYVYNEGLREFIQDLKIASI